MIFYLNYFEYEINKIIIIEDILKMQAEKSSSEQMFGL